MRYVLKSYELVHIETLQLKVITDTNEQSFCMTVQVTLYTMGNTKG